jgi:hypothetical protein
MGCSTVLDIASDMGAPEPSFKSYLLNADIGTSYGVFGQVAMRWEGSRTPDPGPRTGAGNMYVGHC